MLTDDAPKFPRVSVLATCHFTDALALRLCMIEESDTRAEYRIEWLHLVKRKNPALGPRWRTSLVSEWGPETDPSIEEALAAGVKLFDSLVCLNASEVDYLQNKLPKRAPRRLSTYNRREQP